jgi:eukaryotic-like serine/threonine-protein kinase
MSLEGTQLGQYRLLHLIGSGGMGEVYLAEDARINQQVAIKVSRTGGSAYPDTGSASESARLFQREARAIAQLDHPRILPLFTYGEEQVHGETLTYIVMPYRKEGSLATWLRQHNNASILNPQDSAAIVTQAADALQYAHDHNVIHQDVKPANFLVRSPNNANATVPDLLLTDFGIAKLSSATSYSSHTVRGTATYMAPEQWIGDPVAATDQYALAIMAYELLTGRPPFQGRQEQLMYAHVNTPPRPPSSINPRLSGDIDRVLIRALAKKPEERFRSTIAFARALQQAVQSGDTPTVIKPFTGNPALGTMPSPAAATIIPPNRESNPGNANTTAAAPYPITPTPNYAAIQPPVKQKRLSSTLLFLSIICVLLIILASFGVYYVQNTNKQNNSNTNAQALNATATTQALNAAATTQANNKAATATVISTNPYQLPPGETLALNDPLSDNSHGMGWETKPDAGGVCAFINGAYRVTESQSPYFEYCPAYNSDFSNFAFEVQLTFIQGDNAGLLFTNAVTGKYYYFEVDQNGNYLLRVYVGSNGTTLASGFASAFIPGSNQTNILAVVVQNGRFDLYINKQAIGIATDSSYSHGEIGVFVRDVTNLTVAIFSNVKVWTF